MMRQNACSRPAARPSACVTRSDKPPRVDEHQRGAMGENQLGHAIVDLGPHLVAGHRAQFVARNLHGQIHLAAMADIDDARVRRQKLRHLFDGLHRSRESDALRLASRPGHPIAPATAPDASRACRRRRRGSHPRSRSGRSAASRAISRRSARCTATPGVVTRMCGRCLPILLTLGGGRVAGANRRANRRKRDAPLSGQLRDLRQRNFEVLVDVVAQRLERRNIDEPRSRSQASPSRAARTSRSRQIRNAASVLPDPVGAEIRTSRPARISGQPRICGSVGAAKREVNHSATSGSNGSGRARVIHLYLRLGVTCYY